jgi:small subunit ribosomal protein S3
MGQKINPIGFRLGVNRGWDSVWFAKKKEFGKFLIEDFKIRKYIKKNIVNSGVSDIIIERSGKKLIVLKISKDCEVSVNIKEIKKPELNAYLIAENIATQLVKRIAYRRAMKRGMQSASRLGALGIKVMISGRLNGNEIARTEWERDGSIPAHTLRANIDYGVAEALTTYGIIGIKVWVYKGQLYKKDVENEKKERVKNATTSKN